MDTAWKSPNQISGRPTVSVVLTTYNGASYLTQAIESILNQTYPPQEVFVIDDASTDNTSEIVAKYGRFIQYFRHTNRRERCYGRNFGASQATGEYIFFLDYDDYWAPEHIERVLAGWGEAAVVYAYPRKHIDAEGRLRRRSRLRLPSDPGVALFSGWIGFPSALGFRREQYPGFRDEYIGREDWEILLRAWIAGKKLRVLDTDTVHIREHRSRASHSPSLYTATKAIYETYHSCVPSSYLPYFLFHIGEMALRFGEEKWGWSLIREALQRRPTLLMHYRRGLSLLKRSLRFYRRRSVQR
ncbi:MAG: glycosyltransferase [Bacteroidia bacterium]|nr:glycosyltransferase [Bacteroidia bacterium]MDW8235927.1 glycosyltransferase family 2 protein [Bacteroidia bacterium]